MARHHIDVAGVGHVFCKRLGVQSSSLLIYTYIYNSFIYRYFILVRGDDSKYSCCGACMCVEDLERRTVNSQYVLFFGLWKMIHFKNIEKRSKNFFQKCGLTVMTTVLFRFCRPLFHFSLANMLAASLAPVPRGSTGNPVYTHMDPTTIAGAALAAKGLFIAESLYRTCVIQDGGARLRKTGSISPGTSLKHGEARRAFKWASYVGEGKKFFTLAACRKAVQLLLSMPDVEIPFSGMSKTVWIESQAKVVMRLAQRARKNCGASLRFLAYNQSKTMDWEETQVIEDIGGWMGCVNLIKFFISWAII